MRHVVRIAKSLGGAVNGGLGAFVGSALVIGFCLFWIAIIALVGGDETAFDAAGWWLLGKTLAYYADLVLVPLGIVAGFWFRYREARTDEQYG